MKTVLPHRLDSHILARLAQPGEPSMVLKACDIGDVGPFDWQDDSGRSYIFRYDQEHQGHLLKVPLSIWRQNRHELPNVLMGRRNLPFPLVVVDCIQAKPKAEAAPHQGEPLAARIAPQGEPSLAARIAALLRIKSHRASSLASALGASEKAIRDAINAPESGLGFGERGWVILTPQAQA